MGLQSLGKTDIYGIHHLDRGYERMTEKLQNIGANIVRLPVYDSQEIVAGC